MTPIIQQRNAAAIRALKKMESDNLNRRVKEALDCHMARPTDTVKCPCCLKSYTDWNETEFIGWHGICVECEMKGVNDEH